MLGLRLSLRDAPRRPHHYIGRHRAPLAVKVNARDVLGTLPRQRRGELSAEQAAV